MTIIWCMVPEIWSTTEAFVILGPFVPFYPANNLKKNKILKNGKNTWRYHHCTLVYHKWRSSIIWCMVLKYGAWQTHFFVILDHFFPFNPTDDHKNQNFEKMIATSGDIIILHMCTINDNHMMDVYFLKYGAQLTEAFVILSHFLSFYPINTLKKHNFEKRKKHLEISSLYTWCMVPETWEHDREFCHFCPFHPLTTQKINCLKKWKKRLEISFYTSVSKIVNIW